MTELTSTETLRKHMWQGAELLRYELSIGDLVDYLLSLVALKAASDRNDDVNAGHSTADLLGQEGKPGPAIRLGRIPPSAHWSRVKGNLDSTVEDGLVETITEVARKVENADQGLQGVLRALDVPSDCKPSSATVHKLVRHLDTMSLAPSKMEHPSAFGQAVNETISRLVRGGGASHGVYPTPTNVVRVMTGLGRLKPGQSIHDPACGPGGLLVECARRTMGDKARPEETILSGQENSPSMWALARLQLWASGITSLDVKFCDSLEEPLLESDGTLRRYDRVISHVPFGMEKTLAQLEPDQWGRFAVPPQTREMAFLSHIAAILDDMGRAIVLLPQPSLYGRGAGSQQRQALIDAGLVEAVVKLPPAPKLGTAVPMCAVVLDRERRQERDGGILFVDVESIGLEAGATDELEAIVDGLEAREGVSAIVPRERVAHELFDLDVSRYIRRPDVAQAGAAPVNDWVVKLSDPPEKVDRVWVLDAYQCRDLAALEEGVRQGGIVNIVGPFGVGKSTLAKLLAEKLGDDIRSDVVVGNAFNILHTPIKLDEMLDRDIPAGARRVVVLDEWQHLHLSIQHSDVGDYHKWLKRLMSLEPTPALVLVSQSPLAELQEENGAQVFSPNALSRTKTIKVMSQEERKACADLHQLVRKGRVQNLKSVKTFQRELRALRQRSQDSAPHWADFLRSIGEQHKWFADEMRAAGYDPRSTDPSLDAYLVRVQQTPQDFAASLVRPSDLVELFPMAADMLTRVSKAKIFVDAFGAWHRTGRAS